MYACRDAPRCVRPVILSAVKDLIPATVREAEGKWGEREKTGISIIQSSETKQNID